jgi:hypothetical protein
VALWRDRVGWGGGDTFHRPGEAGRAGIHTPGSMDWACAEVPVAETMTIG